MEYTLKTNQYGNVDATKGLPEGWHATKLKASQLKKINVPFYKACTGFRESGGHYSPELANIIPDDYAREEQEYTEKKKEARKKLLEKISQMDLTQECIAECLYSINKEAKRLRDIHDDCIRRAYYDGNTYPAVHSRMHSAKNDKEFLYTLKDEALQTAIRVWSLEPEGYHIFADGKRDMYSFGGHDFHWNRCTSSICLGSIKQEIPAERERSTPPKKAALILQRFVRENREDGKEAG